MAAAKNTAAAAEPANVVEGLVRAPGCAGWALWSSLPGALWSPRSCFWLCCSGHRS